MGAGFRNDDVRHVKAKRAFRTCDHHLTLCVLRYHKSFGLVLLGVILCRVPLRMAAKIPAPLPGNALEHIAAKLSHVTLYAFSIVRHSLPRMAAPSLIHTTTDLIDCHLC